MLGGLPQPCHGSWPRQEPHLSTLFFFSVNLCCPTLLFTFLDASVHLSSLPTSVFRRYGCMFWILSCCNLPFTSYILKSNVFPTILWRFPQLTEALLFFLAGRAHHLLAVVRRKMGNGLHNDAPSSCMQPFNR